MKILFAEADELVERIARERLTGHELLFEKESFGEPLASKYSGIEILSVFIGSRVTRKIIDSVPGLKMIATRSTGFDHIDIEHAKKKGIIVSNVPKYGAWPVAEHVFALLLAGLRKIIGASESAKVGRWRVAGFGGKLIHGKTFGVLGTGDIGLNVCRIAKGFGANVIAYDIVRREKEAKEIGLRYVSLDDLLMNSDIISINLPLTDETHHIIDKRAIGKMKDGVIIINTGRGQVINQNDLVKALKAKKIFFAGLDVLEEEPPEKNEEILHLENAIITPHIAWDTDESRAFIAEKTIENISGFIQGSPGNVIS